MPIDTTPAGSDGWWLDRLSKKLSDRTGRFDMLESYYDGSAGIPIHASKATRDAYRRLMSMARTNFAELVVEALRERMMPVGFRTGAEGDDLGDREARRIWQANALDADHDLVTRTSLSLSDAYVIVGGVDPDLEAPVITPEDPREVITEHDPVRRRLVVAALKVFHDDVDGLDRAFVYRPGYVHEAARTHREGDVREGWEWVDGPRALPYRVVPVVRFANRAKLRGGDGVGEFEPHIPLLNRINYTVLSRLEVATLQAFRQRAIKGVPNVDEAGVEINYDNIFAQDPGALWLLPETAEMWESGQVDLGPIREAIKDDIRDLSAVTRTPMYLFTPDAASGSAEGASLLREGLVFKAEDRIRQASESWEQVMSLAFLFAGDEVRASRRDMEVLWAPPERFSLAERADAASKAVAGGVPWRTIQTDIWQWSPQQVDRMEAERVTDALLNPVPPAFAADAGQ